jgi:hemimethylated DNA binding protein
LKLAGLQGEEAEAAVNRALEAVQALYTGYSAQLQEMRRLRADHANREGVAFGVGTVFIHKKFGYKGVIYGWSRRCERDEEWARTMNVSADQPFYFVLPDEADCQRIFGSIRITKYVAQENIEPIAGTRVLHRALDSYFAGYSPGGSRYIPTTRLQFEVRRKAAHSPVCWTLFGSNGCWCPAAGGCASPWHPLPPGTNTYAYKTHGPTRQVRAWLQYPDVYDTDDQQGLQDDSNVLLHGDAEGGQDETEQEGGAAVANPRLEKSGRW